MKIISIVSAIVLLGACSCSATKEVRLGAPEKHVQNARALQTYDPLPIVNAQASTLESPIYPATDAVDGCLDTRWSSERTGLDQWLYVELYQDYTINRVKIFWETAFASVYDIETSDDAVTWTTRVSVTSGNGGTDIIDMPSGTTGTFVRMKASQAGTRFRYSILEMEVEGVSKTITQGPTTDLTRITAVASSVEPSSPHVATRAVDSSTLTRWSSARTDQQWIYVELDRSYPIHQVILSWEAAYASRYRIQVSDDAVTWRTVFVEKSGNGGTETLTMPPGAEGEFVRVLCDERGTRFGYSLFNINIRGDETAPNEDPTYGAVTPIAAVASSVETQDPTLVAANVIDGQDSTRWASQRTNDQWIYVELDLLSNVRQVRFTWESAYALKYEVQISSTTTAWTTVATENNGQGGVELVDFSSITSSAKFVRMKGVERATQWGYSIRQFEVLVPFNQVPSQDAPANLKVLTTTSAVASSQERSDRGPEKAIDGDKTSTRWASGRTDDEYIIVEFDREYVLYSIELFWESAYALEYEIQVSVDGVNFVTTYTDLNGQGGNKLILFPDGTTGKYVKMLGIDRGTRWGYSLFEIETKGTDLVR